ncbi:lipase family protein [Pseudomaricurvus alkylphenolicus]|jgi:hypothetical protein|nr:lipase family protein [Pseudomaricurvus alkylphenolicus]NIB43612.1 lipase family protein [Pseudomaricurvus alkylphenolicus]
MTSQSLHADSAIDFKEILWYAERAKAAYSSESDIRSRYGKDVLVENVYDIKVQFFVETLPERRQQLVSIRGTDNLSNVKDDSEYIPKLSETLGIYVHRGFEEDTVQILELLRPHLEQEYQIRLTGHSLGAAISTLLMMYLDQEGFELGPSINFGQPKVTNAAGVKKFSKLPLLRVVDREDVVPELPTATLLDSLHGVYAHLGEEVILLKGPYFIALPQHRAIHKSEGSFWKDLGHQSLSDHYIDNYLANIQSKLKQAKAVEFDQRDDYL